MFDELEQNLAGQRTVVVGAGILGTMHALFALAAGRDRGTPRARRHPSRRDGAQLWAHLGEWPRRRVPELTLGLRARALWEEIAVVGAGHWLSRQRIAHLD